MAHAANSYVCELLVFVQAEDGIRDLVRSRGLGDVYKRQVGMSCAGMSSVQPPMTTSLLTRLIVSGAFCKACACLLYTSDAADERSSVDLGGRRIIKKKKTKSYPVCDTGVLHYSQRSTC